ncbi:hypothetical protein niasHT_000371 [Heterodera trifolii]|uniref:Peptidase M10 metallopeptidase domain-containing protein n=1 Tax=Heterodera trifolii TaxID=157864 RepID=A0ABD2MC37_9BILA
MRVIIHLTFLLLPLSVVLLADDFPDSSNSGPLYLCDERSWEAHFETEYVALDQSTRWDTAHLRHKSFALRFQLTGKCENGFLICYPGSLDPSGANWTYGISPETQFQVPNHQESKVAEECLEYQKKFDKNKNQIASLWHGVRVSAPKAFGGIIIELSISKEKYNLSDVQSFNIEFGNARKLMTKVTDETGREIKFSKDEAIRKAFLSNKIKRDAKLRNYTGLWMLGLDVLPMNNQAKMQLHVYRDCGCEMHAWFVHPSDEVPPLLSDHPVVSVDCQTTVQEADSQQFALPTPVGVGRAIRMRRRLNKNPEGIDERVGMGHTERLKSIVKNCTCMKQRRKRPAQGGELPEIARHEAGHAAALIRNTNAVRFISVDIVANGDNLGNTMGDFEPESYNIAQLSAAIDFTLGN